ncbi:MAG: Asp-tRNA(Asn)/Glu-tRNA(Gln) amidotransferase subunit GatA [Candidatus Gracilibacteria bacterium]|nr:Asp-tRNA(Asn)/Glu-tRNA(Gln) amidotransferase subunit GatA [bacterium]MDZ4217253.1 Asp-tRNA(Asn)/Glu-tRNA(Gln) amidotransferase subunit GatA [Candidatus Gracilibacteria bacterium]
MDRTIKVLSEKLRSGKLSSVELTEQCLKAIEEQNGKLNAFISVNREGALTMAKKADEMIAKGEGNELTGIPLGVKDNFCELGVESTACSNVLKGFKPPYEGTVLRKLRGLGAVFIGHTNTDEFTMGGSTETSRFGTSRNPLDPKRTPGGSSGGSAAAVAAGMVPWALGTDTGGSIRQPASFCGLTGLKVTYGRVSRYGVMSMASSLDTIGPITQTPEDAAIVLKVIAGHDPMDATTPQQEVEDYPAELNKEVKGITIGVPKEYLDGLEPEVRKVFDETVKRAKKLGAKIQEISLPMTKYGLAVYYVICPSEVSANMARYDGLRFGPKSDAPNLVESYFESRTKGFGDEVKRRIIIGTYALSAGYYDAYYKKALKVRTLIVNDFKKAFESVDVIFTPTTPNIAFVTGSKGSDPIQMYLEDVMTVPASVAGVPAISIPSGELKGMPLGLQIIGQHFGEGRILQVAHRLS